MKNTGLAIQILTYLLPVVVVLYIVNVVLKRLGLIRTSAQKRDSKAITQGVKNITMSEYFNPLLHLNTSNFQRLPDDLVNSYAASIRKAIRFWGTNEALLFSTFRRFYNKYNISQVADRYLQRYNDDMRSDIINDLSKKDLATLDNIINSLPQRNI